MGVDAVDHCMTRVVNRERLFGGQGKSVLREGFDAELIRAKLLAWTRDVSECMKALKQRFLVCLNRQHERYAILWVDRFKSVLVEESGPPLQTRADYIDRKLIWSGRVEGPEECYL